MNSQFHHFHICFDISSKTDISLAVNTQQKLNTENPQHPQMTDSESSYTCALILPYSSLVHGAKHDNNMAPCTSYVCFELSVLECISTSEPVIPGGTKQSKIPKGHELTQAIETTNHNRCVGHTLCTSTVF